MGTLFDQSPRKYWNSSSLKDDVIYYLEEMQLASDETGETIENCLKAAEIMELSRRNNIFVADGDAKDEQLAGFGNLLQELIEEIRQIAENIKND